MKKSSRFNTKTQSLKKFKKAWKKEVNSHTKMEFSSSEIDYVCPTTRS